MMKKYINKKTIFLVLITAFILFLLPYSISLILAFLTALMLEPIVSFLVKKYKFKRIYSVTLTFIVYLLFLLVLGYLLVNVIINQVMSFIKNIPIYISSFNTDEIMELFEKWQGYYKDLPEDVIISIENAVYSLKDLIIVLAKNITEGTFIFVSSIPTLLLEAIVYLLAVFLILNEVPSIKLKLKGMLQDSSIEKMRIVSTQLKKLFVGFFKAQIIFSGITFILTYIGLWILDVKYVLVLSILTVVVDLLPILGTGSFLVPWAIFALLYGNKTLAIGLVILFVIITVVRKVIEPKVYSSNFGISALAALVSMYLGFKILGIIGLLLGPLLVILYDSLSKAGIINLNFNNDKI